MGFPGVLSLPTCRPRCELSCSAIMDSNPLKRQAQLNAFLYFALVMVFVTAAEE